jgi:hypothetical protein
LGTNLGSKAKKIRIRIPTPAVRMWRANESGRPRIPEGDPDPVPYKPLWGEVEVNPTKRNTEKELLRASESIE